MRVPSAAVACVLAVALGAAADPRIPHLRRQGTATQLVVDGKPFLIRGGELGNSSASNATYLQPFWPRFAELKLNTLLVPVYWELMEPEEGRFDFSLVDQLIAQARDSRMRLVLLWFGSWKNSMSCYAPAWVKRDARRFPRAAILDGTPQEILSPFSAANRDADARAFAALLKHLRETDGESHAVLMIQVENEIGMIPTARDHSAEAERRVRRTRPGRADALARGAAGPPRPGAAARLAGRRRQGRGRVDRRSSAPGRRRRRSSWRGTSRATRRPSPRPARRSTRCRCS